MDTHTIYILEKNILHFKVKVDKTRFLFQLFLLPVCELLTGPFFSNLLLSRYSTLHLSIYEHNIYSTHGVLGLFVKFHAEGGWLKLLCIVKAAGVSVYGVCIFLASPIILMRGCVWTFYTYALLCHEDIVG
jgi:hypothetical protein